MVRWKKYLLASAFISIAGFAALYIIPYQWWKLTAWSQIKKASHAQFRDFNANNNFFINENASALKAIALDNALDNKTAISSTSKLLERDSDETTISIKSSIPETNSIDQRSVIGTAPQCPINDKCFNSKTIKWRMFIFVKTAAHLSLKRNNVRKTWGSVKYVDGGQFSIIFLVGRTKDAKQQSSLDDEINRFGDILQVDENDEYSHVVYKTLRGMKWASEHLNDDDYYSSCDDDMMVNMGKLQEKVEKYIGEKASKAWPEFPLICSYDTAMGVPVRSEKHKNYISLQEYKWTEWPRFCLGGMYTTSVSVIKQLYEVSKTVKPLQTDDVWITGVLRNIYGMPESMVVVPRPKIAQHVGLHIYNGRHSDEETTRMFQVQWRDAYNQFSSKSLCKC